MSSAPCPSCAHAHKTATLSTSFGQYYLCPECGLVWHEDHLSTKRSLTLAIGERPHRRASMSATHPLPFNCPACGRSLHVRGFRSETDPNGQPETVDIYYCFKDGFFTYTNRKGLVEGL